MVGVAEVGVALVVALEASRAAVSGVAVGFATITRGAGQQKSATERRIRSG